MLASQPLLQRLVLGGRAFGILGRSSFATLAAEMNAEKPAKGSSDSSRVPTTPSINWLGSTATVPSYQTIDATGKDVQDGEVPHPISQDLATKIYTCMAKLQTMVRGCVLAAGAVHRRRPG